VPEAEPEEGDEEEEEEADGGPAQEEEGSEGRNRAVTMRRRRGECKLGKKGRGESEGGACVCQRVRPDGSAPQGGMPPGSGKKAAAAGKRRDFRRVLVAPARERKPSLHTNCLGKQATV